MRDFVAFPFKAAAFALLFCLCVIGIPVAALVGFLNGVGDGIKDGEKK